MNKKIKFTFTSVWIIFSRCYDAYCTNLLTPDLSKEANPLVTVVGISSWTTLLTILGLLTIYVIYAYYLSVFKPMNLLPAEKGYSFGNFAAYIYLGFKDSWTAILYKLPKDLKRLNIYMGHVMSRCLAFAGIVSTVMWLLIHHSALYPTLHSPALIYTILIGGSVIIAYFWNKSLYKKYRFAGPEE